MPDHFKFYTTSREAWDAMYHAIRKAQHSIKWESYIFIDDNVGAEFVDLLCDKAKEGVKVKLIVDAWASFWLSENARKKLEAHGAAIQYFHPLFRRHKQLGRWGALWERTHRKVLIIDENAAFIGGVNVQKEFADWYDLTIKITKQIVKNISDEFDQTWNYVSNKRWQRLKDNIESLRQTGWTVLYHTRRQYKKRVATLLRLALRRAQKNIFLVSAYFLPTPLTVKRLIASVKRGLHIRLLSPWTTELKFITPVMRDELEKISKTGIEVRVITKNMLHAKAILVDDAWAAVGSSNIDKVSFNLNREMNLITEHQGAVKEIKKILETWWQEALPISEVAKTRPRLRDKILGLPMKLIIGLL